VENRTWKTKYRNPLFIHVSTEKPALAALRSLRLRPSDLPVPPGQIAQMACANSNTCVFIGKMARPERFELPTLCFEGRCSIQLSYGRV
jgi:hypothetical protein